ncbi:hypothetical protein DFS34DRAFT_627857 [Phlyctochytrium arcticum]|nr:hypothetical protein DFS34DRAFT_627857 [Phlyctochytrium arcticum]
MLERARKKRAKKRQSIKSQRADNSDKLQREKQNKMSSASLTTTTNSSGPYSDSDDHRLSRGGPTQYRAPSSPTVADGQLPPDPAELILTRCAGWLSLVRLLILQFDDQASLEKSLALSQTKTHKHWINNPSRERDLAFASSPGIAQLSKCLRETCTQLATEHEGIHKVLATQTLPGLRAAEKEIHKKMTVLIDEEKSRKKEKEKDDTKLKTHIKQLQRSLTAAQNVGKTSAWEAGDPWLANLATTRHVQQASAKHRSHSHNLADLEQNFGTWEKGLLRNIKSALLAYTSLQSVASTSHGATISLQHAVNALEPDIEWENYRTNHLAKSATLEAFAPDYPGSEDALVRSVKEGPVMRKSKVLKKWKEHWYVLSAAGWLHEFEERPSLEGPHEFRPKTSIWLRTCELTPLGVGVAGNGGQGVTAEEFHLTEVKEHHMFSKKRHVFKLSTNSVSDSAAWWAALAQVVPFQAPSTGLGSGVGAHNANVGEGALASGHNSNGTNTPPHRRMSDASTASSVSRLDSPTSPNGGDSASASPSLYPTLQSQVPHATPLPPAAESPSLPAVSSGASLSSTLPAQHLDAPTQPAVQSEYAAKQPGEYQPVTSAFNTTTQKQPVISSNGKVEYA